MARKFFNDGQEIVQEDLNGIGAAVERSLYDRVLYEIVQKTTDAFFGTGFKVSYLGPTSVSVNAGFGFQNDSTAVSPEPTKKPLYLAASVTKNLQSPDTAFTRKDIVCVKYTLATELTASRKYKDATSGVISTQSFTVQKDDTPDIVVVNGVPSASPATPATPAGYLKIATLNVPAVSGMSGAGDVTDNRSLMPLGSSTLLNTSGYFRLTAGSAVALSTLVADMDAYLYRGKFNYLDLEELDTAESDAEPGSPPTDFRRIFHRDGVLYIKDAAGVKAPVGSGGGGGAGAAWYAVEGDAPVKSEEFGNEVWFFEKGAGQKAVLWLKVPNSFLPGRQISMKLSAYSLSASLAWQMGMTTTLVRFNTDAVDSVANQYAATTLASVTNTVAKQLKELSADLTNSTGTINGFSVQPGDMIKVELTRLSDTDTADVRLIPSATEVKFG